MARPKGRYVKGPELLKLKAAQKCVSGIYFMMMLGLFETIDPKTKEGLETRKWFGDYMQPWEDIVYPPPAEEPSDERE